MLRKLSTVRVIPEYDSTVHQAANGVAARMCGNTEGENSCAGHLIELAPVERAFALVALL